MEGVVNFTRENGGGRGGRGGRGRSPFRGYRGGEGMSRGGRGGGRGSPFRGSRGGDGMSRGGRGGRGRSPFRGGDGMGRGRGGGGFRGGEDMSRGGGRGRSPFRGFRGGEGGRGGRGGDRGRGPFRGYRGGEGMSRGRGGRGRSDSRGGRGSFNGREHNKNSEPTTQVPADDAKNGIRITNLPENVQSVQQDLLDTIVDTVGPVKQLIYKKWTSGAIQGADCVFEDPSDFSVAIEKLHGKEFNGHHLVVEKLESFNDNAQLISPTCVFVSDLAKEATIEDLWQLFQSCGKLGIIRILHVAFLNQALVNFEDAVSVSKALKLNGKEIRNSTLNVVPLKWELSVYISNLDESVRHEDVSKLLSECHIAYSRVEFKHANHRNAFASFADKGSLQRGLALSGKVVKGLPITVVLAKDYVPPVDEPIGKPDFEMKNEPAGSEDEEESDEEDEGEEDVEEEEGEEDEDNDEEDDEESDESMDEGISPKQEMGVKTKIAKQSANVKNESVEDSEEDEDDEDDEDGEGEEDDEDGDEDNENGDEEEDDEDGGDDDDDEEESDESMDESTIKKHLMGLKAKQVKQSTKAKVLEIKPLQNNKRKNKSSGGNFHKILRKS